MTTPTSNKARISVLIIDRRQSFADLLAHYLTRAGEFDIVGAVAQLEEGVKLSKSAQPQVVVFGFSSRNSEALELLRRLRILFRDSFIVATCFEPDDRGARAVRDAGMDAYLSGFDIDTQLLPTIRNHFSPQP
jgi:DNA-binding NarL/FixJ family response regulator